MDTDLKPVQAPLVNPEEPDNTSGPADIPDPFKPDGLPRRPTTYVSKKHRGGRGKVVLLILLALVVLGGTTYGVYYWQHREVKKANARISELNNEVTQLQGQVDTLEADAQNLEKEVTAETAVNTDDAVVAAAQASCQATLDPATNQALVFTVGTIGTAKKKVVYSADKNFASLTATCGTAAAPGASQTYYIKNVNGAWVVVYKGTTADAATIKLYGIPTAFN